MVDCFSLISNYQFYKAEIRAYLVNEPTQEKFTMLVDDIIKSASTASTGDLKEELSTMNEMLFTVSSDEKRQKIFASEYVKCTNRLFATKDSDIFFCMADALQDAYHRFNKIGKEFYVFNAVCFEFYTGLKYLNLSDAHKYGVLNSLRFELFHNSAYNNSDELCSFTARIYQFAAVDNIYLLNTASSKDHFVTGMYDWFSPFQVFSTYERQDHLNFLKTLVDSQNKTILNEKFYNNASIRPNTDWADRLFIILYIYYIGTREPLAENDQIRFCCDYIEEKRDCFKQIIRYCEFYNISASDIELSYNLMKSWEIVIGNSIKTSVFDSVTNDFWVFSFMAVNFSMESLSNALQKIVDGREFKLYSQYFADDTAAANTIENYADFCKLFGLDFNETAVKSLEFALSYAFKQSSIQEAEREHNTLMKDGGFITRWTQVVNDYCEQIAKHFSDKPEEVTSEHAVLVDHCEFCFELSRKENERLKNMIEFAILKLVCKKMQPRLKIEEVKYGEPLSPIIKALNDTVSNPVDTVIGSRNCFSYQEHKEEQQMLEKFGEKFLSHSMHGAIFFVSKSGFFADFSNIKIHLQEPTQEEILSKFKPNEKGIYSYYITNNLIGDFAEEEFVSFIQNRTVNLKITCDFTYGFSSEQIGYGINIQFPQD